LAWHLLAICREKAGDFTAAMNCYEAALKLNPDDPDLANDIGRLAYQMGMPQLAEQLFRIVVAKKPGFVDGYNNLACALRDQMRHAEALAVLTPAVSAHPGHAMLWNTLGTVVNEQGEVENAVPFYAEALRLEPELAKARYNLANARLALGDVQGALEDSAAAFGPTASDSERAMMRFARATMLLAAGRVEEGWRAYAARLDESYADVAFYLIDRPGWTPEADLRGKTLLLIGEQGLGDEVLFANMLPEVIEALGPEGKLWLAVEPRLVGLFQRSFPAARVTRHATYRVDHRTVRAIPELTDPSEIDLWAPLASPLERFRTSVGAFPERRAFLHPDPERISHWRATLDAETTGRRVGLVWKSLKINSARSRFFSPFDAWAPVLRTPGTTMINLQYGDCAAELARARDELGVEIWSPPGINLKDDLEDVAALCCALDLVIGPANASTNLAAASGAPTWFICTPGAWPLLGTGRYPWYPSARCFTPRGFNRWEPVMAEIAMALASA
jgi:cytochrome c-type biogenesis protein CcmH/NrfG